MSIETSKDLRKREEGIEIHQTTTKHKKTRYVIPVVLISMVLIGAIVYNSCCKKTKTSSPITTSPTIAKSTNSEAKQRLLETEENEQALIEKIAVKLQPVELKVYDENDDDFDVQDKTVDRKIKPTLKPHQFLHLHHMKTGGTSMDHMMRCALDRLKNTFHDNNKKVVDGNDDVESQQSNAKETSISYNVPYFSIHECSRARFEQCLQDENNSCRPQMKQAAVMSYCSALKYLQEFGWTEWDFNSNEFKEQSDQDKNETSTFSSVEQHTYGIKAFTVLRHPVDRVWSMFKFQTRLCYKCTDLKEIYKKIDENQTEHFDTLCLNQLRNHEVANLLTSTHWPEHPDDDETQDAMVAEAVENMKKYFTVIGLTEELPETAHILGTVFPWMNETLEGYDKTCPLPHDNSSPANNHCVDNGPHKPTTHWDLPKHPDQETYDAILAHNRMDVKLYEAAVSYFELQKRAIESGEQDN